MAVHALSQHFARFFPAINPRRSFEQTAAREHQAITNLIESSLGPARVLEPQCFLQGSYRQETAIHSINDVDIVALCALWHPGSGSGGGRTWSRDDIFDALARAIAADRRFAPHIDYGSESIVIKVHLDIKVEILPVVFKAGNYDPSKEPFRLYRPDIRELTDGFARYHQYLLSEKNAPNATQGNFKPMIKVLKHMRDRFGLDAVSFHLECLLYKLPDAVFRGGPADYIGNVLSAIAGDSANAWYSRYLSTPCGDRDIFTAPEWDWTSWSAFHHQVVDWAEIAAAAAETADRSLAIRAWRALLGDEYFPSRVVP
jgi:hypothetical protein